METSVVNPGITQPAASPGQPDNLASLTTSDIANQIAALQSQPESAPAVETGINQEAAQTVPIVDVNSPVSVTQPEPNQTPVDPVGLAELERLRIENETLQKRYSDSTREALALLEKTRLLEAQTKQVQEQQRRWTDEEVDNFVAQQPEYASWGNTYKRENLILEVKESVRKEQDEREQKIRFNTESNSALDRAKREFPDAFKVGTPLQKLAAEIYNSRPSFRNDPQGAYYAAELAKARLIPASTPAPTANVTSQGQAAGNSPFVEKGNSTPVSRVDVNNLTPEAVAKMSLADLARILPKVDQY